MGKVVSVLHYFNEVRWNFEAVVRFDDGSEKVYVGKFPKFVTDFIANNSNVGVVY